MRLIIIYSLVSSILVGCNQAPSLDKPQRLNTKIGYSMRTLYQPEQNLASYEPIPHGYTLVFSEMLARHGARTLTKATNIDLSFQLWQLAKKSGDLTALGWQLGPEIVKLKTVSEKIGYGNLSQIGANEHTQLAQRMSTRLAKLLSQLRPENKHIRLITSGEARAVASMEFFRASLQESNPQLAGLIEAPRVDRNSLYFHKNGSASANAYQKYISSNKVLLFKIKSILEQDKSQQISRAILAQLYNPKFVAKLAQGIILNNSQGKPILVNTIQAARMLYDLYAIAPGLKQDLDLNFAQFIYPAAAEWLAYLNDVEAFYSKGPSFSDNKITYWLAQPLVNDFFKQITELQTGNSQAGLVLRFAHAETIIPFAALLQIEGSQVGVTESEQYNYAANPWRGADVAPFAANVQWDVYRNQQNNYLVKMYYNEKEIKFKLSCQPYQVASFYYDFDELKKCYAVQL